MYLTHVQTSPTTFPEYKTKTNPNKEINSSNLITVLYRVPLRQIMVLENNKNFLKHELMVINDHTTVKVVDNDNLCGTSNGCWLFTTTATTKVSRLMPRLIL